jgi:hypothetical protein
LTSGKTAVHGKGTLFIAPTPGYDNFEQLYNGIQAQDFAEPWGVLLKDRGLIKEDFEWWKARGFRTHCLGDYTNPNYFQDLEKILTKYDEVATAHFSSAAIFGASLARRVRIITNVCMRFNYYLDFGQGDFLNFKEDKYGNLKSTWTKLTSSDLNLAQETALQLLGSEYMGSREELKKRYLDAVSKITKPLHLYPLGESFLYRFFLKIIEFGIPIYKIYPSPVRKLMTRLISAIGFQSFIYVVSADFHDYEIVGNKKLYKEKRMWFFYPFLSERQRIQGSLPKSLLSRLFCRA